MKFDVKFHVWIFVVKICSSFRNRLGRLWVRCNFLLGHRVLIPGSLLSKVPFDVSILVVEVEGTHVGACGVTGAPSKILGTSGALTGSLTFEAFNTTLRSIPVPCLINRTIMHTTSISIFFPGGWIWLSSYHLLHLPSLKRPNIIKFKNISPKRFW